MTTGVKPPLPNETRPQARELSVATPETPLRSAVDIEEDALADESFDGEFVGIGDAFFPDADQSVNTDIGAGTG